MSFKDQKLDYLDKGWVILRDYMGDDVTMADFARDSYGKSANEYTYEQNVGLINRLFEHYHTSPIESGEMVFSIKLPIFVMRQHVRHRTASLNELSLRYREHDGDYYVPELENLRTQDNHWNKQGSLNSLPVDVATEIRNKIISTSESCYQDYQDMISKGLARESARSILPVNFYTVVTWKMDTKNLFHYLKLRDDPHAQWEIRELAGKISHFVSLCFPEAYKAYLEYWKDSVTFSATEIKLLRQMIDFDKVELPEDINGSKRRLRDFITKLEG